jgi:hypothetical protein
MVAQVWVSTPFYVDSDVKMDRKSRACYFMRKHLPCTSPRTPPWCICSMNACVAPVASKICCHHPNCLHAPFTESEYDGSAIRTIMERTVVIHACGWLHILYRHA